MKRILFAAAALVLTSSAAQAQYVDVTLSEWKIDMKSDTVKAGRVTFQIKNEGTMAHAVRVKGDSVDKGTKDIPKKGAGTLMLTLKPGTYEIFCPMSESTHKMAGMSRKIVVVAAAGAKKP